MISNDIDAKVDVLPEENRLVDQAKAGDTNAFVQLYDGYVEGVYRYVYFRVINDAAAEDITSEVFLNAWERLGSYQTNDSSFVAWIFEIAKNQVLDYYKTNLKSHAIDIDFLSLPADFGLNKEVKDLIKLETMRSHLRYLTAEPKQDLISKIFNRGTTNRKIGRLLAKLENDVHTLQVLTLQTIAKFLEYLNLGREIKPSPKFNAHTRLWLIQYLQFHSRRQQRSSLLWRMSWIYAVVIAALLVTGTAKAQSALPGDPLYSWKRTSEQALLTLSPDPTGTDIFIADRRLNELIAVGNDPARSANASNDYYDALTKLKSIYDAFRLEPLLKAHRQRLSEAGMSTSPLDNYMTSTAASGTNVTSVNIAPNQAVQSVNPGSSEVIQPSTSGVSSNEQQSKSESNGAVQPIIEIPTDVVSPETAAAPVVPIDSSQPTVVPTEAAQPPTLAPTDVAPPATEAPTTVALQPTPIPSEVVLPATDVLPVVATPATDSSTGNSNPVFPGGTPVTVPPVQTP